MIKDNYIGRRMTAKQVCTIGSLEDGLFSSSSAEMCVQGLRAFSQHHHLNGTRLCGNHSNRLIGQGAMVILHMSVWR